MTYIFITFHHDSFADIIIYFHVIPLHSARPHPVYALPYANSVKLRMTMEYFIASYYAALILVISLTLYNDNTHVYISHISSSDNTFAIVYCILYTR